MIETVEPTWIMAQIEEDCPGAPFYTVRRALTRALKKFSDSGMVSVWLDIPTQECVASYPLEDYVCEGMSITAIPLVKYCGKCIPCADECSPCPTGYQVDDLHHITLLGGYVPAGNGTDDLQVKVVLSVTNDSCEVPKDIAEKYEEALIDGTLFYLLRQKGKKWTDFKLSAYYGEQFEGKIASAKCAVSSSFGKQTNRIMGARIL